MRAALLVAATLALAGCAARPAPTAAPAPSLKPAAKPATVEEALGLVVSAALALTTSPYDDPVLAGYVSRVGDRVAAGSPGNYRFVVTNGDDVDACAATGGTVLVSRSTLAVLGSEAELAALLGHEIGHLALGHGLSSFWVSSLGIEDDRAFGAERGRDKQLQADRHGLALLRVAGYEPAGASRMLERVYAAGRMAGNEGDPPERVRLAAIARHLVGVPSAGEVGRDVYLDHIDRMVHGPDPRDGYATAKGFASTRDGFALDLPHGLRMRGKAHEFEATSPGGARLDLRAFRQVEMVDVRGKLLEEIRQGPHRERSAAGLRVVAGKTVIDGAPWPTALILARDRTWLLVASGKGAQARLDEVIDRMRPAREGEDAPAPARLRIRAARAAGPLSDVAASTCRARQEPRALATLNGVAIEDVVPKGTRIKCVE